MFVMNNGKYMKLKKKKEIGNADSDKCGER